MTSLPSPSLSLRESNLTYWNRRRQVAREDYDLSLSVRDKGLEEFPQGIAEGTIFNAWYLLLSGYTDEAQECARFAYLATETALARKHFSLFFTSFAQREPHLRHLNNLAGQLACGRIQFSARWILEGVPPLDLLNQSLNIWPAPREERPQWFSEPTVLLDCILAERWDDALWLARYSARRSGLRLKAAEEINRPPRGEIATLALLAEIALGRADEKATILIQRAVANWCARSRDWPHNIVGLSVRERVAWFYLWHRHFGPQLPPFAEMLQDLRGE